MTRLAFYIGNKAYAAGVFLLGGVIEALLRRETKLQWDAIIVAHVLLSQSRPGNAGLLGNGSSTASNCVVRSPFALGCWPRCCLFIRGRRVAALCKAALCKAALCKHCVCRVVNRASGKRGLSDSGRLDAKRWSALSGNWALSFAFVGYKLLGTRRPVSSQIITWVQLWLAAQDSRWH